MVNLGCHWLRLIVCQLLLSFKYELSPKVEMAGAQVDAHPIEREDLSLETQEFPTCKTPSFSKSVANRQGINISKADKLELILGRHPKALPILSQNQLYTGLTPNNMFLVLVLFSFFNFQTQ